MKKYTLLLIVMSFISCQSESNYSSKEALSTSTASVADISQKSKSDESQTIKKKIIKSASIRFEVIDVTSAVDDISMLVSNYEGYVSDQNMVDINGKQDASIVLRVPSDSLDALMREVSLLAIHVDYMKVNSKDVSEEYVDLTTRLKTKEEVHHRYIDILRNKAGTIEELLAAERRIGVLQEEIEAAQGKLRFYDDKVSLSNVNMQIYTKEILTAKVESRFLPFWSNAENEFISGWNMLMRLGIILVGIWPLLLIGGLVLGFRKRLKGWVSV